MNIIKNKYAVFLDKGHGKPSRDVKQITYKDGSYYKTHMEYELNKKVFKRLKQKINNLNIDFIETIFKDNDIALNQRIQNANWLSSFYEKTIFISLHFNGSPNHNAKGGECFVGSSNNSFSLGKLCEKHYRSLLPGNHFRGVKKANLAVTRDTKMPAILIEFEFYDNKKNYDWINIPENLDKFAEITYRLIIDYFK